jgi:hypothetical protein
MTRLAGMTASSDLFTPWPTRKRLPMRSVFTRVLCAAIALGGLAVAAFLTMPQARAIEYFIGC